MAGQGGPAGAAAGSGRTCQAAANRVDYLGVIELLLLRGRSRAAGCEGTPAVGGRRQRAPPEGRTLKSPMSPRKGRWSAQGQAKWALGEGGGGGGRGSAASWALGAGGAAAAGAQHI
jgi:hypothetical protein